MIRSSSSFFGGIFLLGFFGAANPLQKVQFALAVLFGVSETWTCDPKIISTISFFCRFSFLPGRNPLNNMKKSLAPSPPPKQKNTSAQPKIPWAKKFPLRKTLQRFDFSEFSVSSLPGFALADFGRVAGLGFWCCFQHHWHLGSRGPWRVEVQSCV